MAGRVPAHKHFHAVAIGHDGARRQHDLAHVVEVAQRHQIFQVVELADRDGQRQHHRKARINGARDEVWRKDRGMPAGHRGDREVETNGGVYRKHQRRGKTGQQQRR